MTGDLDALRDLNQLRKDCSFAPKLWAETVLRLTDKAVSALARARVESDQASGEGFNAARDVLAERDAIAAAAFEAAAERLKMEEGTFIASRVISAIRSLTPPDARAALDRLIADKVAVAVRGEERAGWNAAIAWVEKHLADYVAECGSYDPETGVTEFPDGGEWQGSVQDIIDGMRLAMPAALAADGEA